MSIYLDASVIVALFVADPLSGRAHETLAGKGDVLIVSDYAALEFSAAVARFARSGMMTAKDARTAVLEFDNWTAANCEAPQTVSADIALANGFVRLEDVALRASDAVHVAIAQRLGARLLTFDKKLASNARRLGLPLA